MNMDRDCKTLYDTAKNSNDSGSLRGLWGFVLFLSLTVGEQWTQRNRRKEHRVDQHKFVALSCLWTSEERTQIILQQVKKEKSKHSLPLHMNWMIIRMNDEKATSSYRVGRASKNLPISYQNRGLAEPWATILKTPIAMRVLELSTPVELCPHFSWHIFELCAETVK